jgi:hypothetical protein
MADLTSIEKLNLSLKMVFGIQGLSNTSDATGLQWYEEKNSWRPFLVNQDLWANAVPPAADSTAADDNVTANPGTIEKRDIKLSLVNGTNYRAWAAYITLDTPSSGIYDNWLLPQIFGQGYAMRLFQDNGSGTGVGTEISTTQGAWIPSYKLGFVVLGAANTASIMGWSTPLWARVYRYIGPKGISGSTANVSLQDAYENNSTIIIDSNGPVILNSTTSSNAPFEIVSITTAPTTNLSAGQMTVVNGMLYVFDSTRGKWLSADKRNVSYEIRYGNGVYLSTNNQSDHATGWTALSGGTILGVSAAGGHGNQTKKFSIRKNGVDTDLFYFNLAAGKYVNSSLSLDFSAGDVIQIYCYADTQGNGGLVYSPRVALNIAPSSITESSYLPPTTVELTEYYSEAISDSAYYGDDSYYA